MIGLDSGRLFCLWNGRLGGPVHGIVTKNVQKTLPGVVG